eukprot:g1035.t1
MSATPAPETQPLLDDAGGSAAGVRLRADSWSSPATTPVRPSTPLTPRHFTPTSMRTLVHNSIDILGASGSSGGIGHETEGLRAVGSSARPRGEGSFFGSTCVFVQSIIGGGLLTYPQAYQRSGIGAILVVQMVLMVAIVAGLRYLALAAERTHSDTYQSMMRRLGGPRLEMACEVAIVFLCFGACVAYLDIMVDQAQPFSLALANNDATRWYTNRDSLAILLAALTFCLCLIRNISGLSIPSMLGVLAMFFVAFVVLYEHFALHDPSRAPRTAPPPPPTDVRWFKGSAMTFLSALPVICFSFQGHISAIPLYAEMRHRTLRNFDLVIGLGLAICIVIYNLTGWVGYLSFGDDTASDILVNLSTTSPLVNIARLCVALAVATSYAILHFCARKVLLDHFGAFLATPHIVGSCPSLADTTTPQRQPRLAFFFVTSVWAVMVLLLVLKFPDVGEVVSFVGNLAACFMFIFPGIALCSLSRVNGVGDTANGGLKHTASARVALAAQTMEKENATFWRHGISFVAFGCVVFTVGLCVCILRVVHGDS